MKLIGYLLLVALFISWAAVVNFCLALVSAPSDTKLYLGIAILLFSVLALTSAAKRVIKTFTIKPVSKENPIETLHQ